MKMRKRILLIAIFLSFCLLNTQVAEAYTKLVLDTSALYTLGDKDKSILTHSTGKFIIAYFDNTNDKIIVEIVTLLGTSETTIEISMLYDSSYMSLSLTELDNDEILLAHAYRASASGVSRVWVWKINIISYSYSSCTGSPQNLALTDSSSFRLSISRGYEYDDNLYFVVRIQQTQVAVKNYLTLIKYTVSTNTISTVFEKATGETPDYPDGNPPLYIEQDENSPELLYILTTDADDDQRPTYYIMDLSGTSADTVKLATHPQTARIRAYLKNMQQYYMGGGKYISGDFIYLYWTWIYPDLYYESYRKIIVIQHRLVFNLTVDDDTLLFQNERTITIYPNLLTSPTYNCWAIGFLENKQDLIVYYPYIEDEEYHIMKDELEVSDWLDTDDTAIYLIDYEETEDIPPQNAVIDWIAREPNSPFQVNCHYTGYEIWVYSGLVAWKEEWDISISYTPVDTPPFTDTSYRFTATSLLNDYPRKSTLIGYFDNVQFFSSSTNSIGQYQFTIQTSVSGYHELQIKLYSNNIYRYNETWNYVFITRGEEYPETETLLPISVGLILNYLPIFLVYGSLIFGFSELNFGIIGFIVAIILGTVICALSGLIPQYVVYLMVLAIVTATIYFMRKE